MIGLIRPQRPSYVPLNVWINLTYKEQDYLYIITLDKRVNKQDLKRMLYFKSDWGLEKFRRRLMGKLHNTTQ